MLPNSGLKSKHWQVRHVYCDWVRLVLSQALETESKLWIRKAKVAACKKALEGRTLLDFAFLCKIAIQMRGPHSISRQQAPSLLEPIHSLTDATPPSHQNCFNRVDQGCQGGGAQGQRPDAEGGQVARPGKEGQRKEDQVICILVL